MSPIYRAYSARIALSTVVIPPHIGGRIARVTLMLLMGAVAFAQAPGISAAGVVNAASFAQPIVPGSLVSIFGTNLAKEPAAAGTPLPTELGGVSVAINGVKAPLLFVSRGQINLQVPWATSICYGCSDYETASFVVTSAAGSSATAQVPISFAAPAIFTAGGSGCGHAEALNVLPDGTVSRNSPTNSARPATVAPSMEPYEDLSTVCSARGSNKLLIVASACERNRRVNRAICF